jgi:hypothetical protein
MICVPAQPGRFPRHAATICDGESERSGAIHGPRLSLESGMKLGMIRGMKTAHRKVRTATTANGTPGLHSGDRLTQAEFHRRYIATPEHVKAELIGGVVYMASPVHRLHATYHLKLAVAIGHYEGHTFGVEAADNHTAILGGEGEPQPDLMLRVLPEYGGQSRCDDNKCLIGAPELVAEVAHSSVAIDMSEKKNDYFRAGVQEYIVLCIEEEELHWFHFPSRRQLRPDRAGIWRSKVFPGLWINGPALIQRKTPPLIATVQQGLASPEHAAFVRKLQARQ